jgi:DNA-binding NarL/FixJ family response regulator
MSGEGRLKILLADVQYLFAGSLEILIKNNTGDIDVAGIARNGKEAVQLASDLQPDIVLMDIGMSASEGIDVVHAIKQKQPGIKIVMWLSACHDEELIKSAFLAGASGYLLRDLSPTELIMVLRTINNSIIQISPEIFRRIITSNIYISPPPPPNNPKWYSKLTRREREVIVLIAEGYSNQEIAKKLFIAPQTVNNQVSGIYAKLGINNRFGIIQLANKHQKFFTGKKIL